VCARSDIAYEHAHVTKVTASACACTATHLLKAVERTATCRAQLPDLSRARGTEPVGSANTSNYNHVTRTLTHTHSHMHTQMPRYATLTSAVHVATAMKRPSTLTENPLCRSWCVLRSHSACPLMRPHACRLHVTAQNQGAPERRQRLPARGPDTHEYVVRRATRDYIRQGATVPAVPPAVARGYLRRRGSTEVPQTPYTRAPGTARACTHRNCEHVLLVARRPTAGELRF
jgi:hypothetical protein